MFGKFGPVDGSRLIAGNPLKGRRSKNALRFKKPIVKRSKAERAFDIIANRQMRSRYYASQRDEARDRCEAFHDIFGVKLEPNYIGDVEVKPEHDYAWRSLDHLDGDVVEFIKENGISAEDFPSDQCQTLLLIAFPFNPNGNCFGGSGYRPLKDSDFRIIASI